MNQLPVLSPHCLHKISAALIPTPNEVCGALRVVMQAGSSHYNLVYKYTEKVGILWSIHPALQPQIWVNAPNAAPS
jgi:hypothetical protein